MAEEKCVFCRIARGELPSWRIFENNAVIGILDTNPSAEGHCLIIPKRHVRSWHDLSDAEVAAVFNSAKTVARKIKQQYAPDFVCVFIRGGRVKHTHVVLFPSSEGDKLSGFPQSVLGKADINFEKVQEKLKINDVT
ncbi:MAG TPA: HIT family protein [Verrucomicrobiae bacterium]|nr:HIT family protein [Verrucomicrobiae bacterium]